MALHLIHKPTPALLTSAFNMIADNDIVVLMHCPAGPIAWPATLPDTVTVWWLDGTSSRSINLQRLITLSAEHNPVVSWF
jgi:hypothetical protein